VKVEFAEDAL
jgi:hypothetical protein